MSSQLPVEAQQLKLVVVALLTTAALAVSCGSSGDTAASSTSTRVDDTTTQPPTTGGTGTDTTTPTTGTTASSHSSSDNADGQTTIEVFFNVEDPDECAAVDGYPRTAPFGVNAIDHAFDQLVSGPTADDTGASSFFSSDTKAMVRSATLTDGQLVVGFADVRSVLGPAGATTSCGSAALLSQLNATAFQLAEVDAARYEINGSCTVFGQWLQRDCIEVTRSDWEDQVAGQLPGEPFDGILPTGTALAVVGVEADDVLIVRALPGSRQNIVDTLQPLATGLTFTGRERLVSDPTSIWYEINTGSSLGWVNARFVSPLAGVNDVTPEVVSVLGALPSSETAVQVAELLIEARLEGIDADPTVVLVDGPHSGGDRLTEITYDILGFYDDAVRGERLHIFITPTDVADGPMTLFSVEATTICARGNGTSELCP